MPSCVAVFHLNRIRMVVIAIAFSMLPIPEQVLSGFFVGILSSVVVIVPVNYLHAKTVGRPNTA